MENTINIMEVYEKTSKKTLVKHLANHTLTDYLQTLTDGELEQAYHYLFLDDLVGDALDILSAITIEKEYRSQEPQTKSSLTK